MIITVSYIKGSRWLVFVKVIALEIRCITPAAYSIINTAEPLLSANSYMFYVLRTISNVQNT